MWLDSLKVGDKVGVQRGRENMSTTVERITATLVVTKAGRFNRKTGFLVGGSMYDHSKLVEWTDEYKEKAVKYERKKWFENLNNPTDKQLEVMFDAYHALTLKEFK